MTEHLHEPGLSLSDVAPERWGRAVLNIRESEVPSASDTLQRMVEADRAGDIDLEDVDWTNLQLTDRTLAGRTVIPTQIIRHAAKDGELGEFNGWYVGEEYHSLQHPLLLLTPEDVVFSPRPLFR